MLSPQLLELVAPARRRQMLIWFSFLNAAVIYAIIAYFVSSRQMELERPPDAELLRRIAIAVSAGLAVGAQLYRGWALSDETLKEKLRNSEPDLSGGVRSESSTKKRAQLQQRLEQLSEQDRKLAGLITHHQTSMVVSWAALDTIAIIGLVLDFLRVISWTSVPYFTGSAIALLALTRPDLPGYLERGRTLSR